jgi:predicted RNase H-like HicB family nuclease
MAREQRTLAEYRSLPYRREVRLISDEDGTYYVASFSELPGLLADGETRAEAVMNLSQAFDDYINAHLEWGEDIPEPDGSERIVAALWSTAEPPNVLVINPLSEPEPSGGSTGNDSEVEQDDREESWVMYA